MTRPYCREKSCVKISATATSEVTCGSSTAMRKKVRARSLVFSRCASQSAIRSWGTVAISQMPSVFSTAFQKYESWIRFVKLSRPTKCVSGFSSVRSVSATHAV